MGLLKIPDKKTYEFRFSGYGGQGVILSAVIVGKASSLFDSKHSTLIKSFGPEARGSACSAQVVMSDTPVLYPYVVKSDFLISMSQVAYEKFSDELNIETGVLIYESEMVHPTQTERKFGIPATRLAEEKLGKTIYLNIIMLGYFTQVTGLVSRQAMEDAIKGTVPSHTVDQNLEAFKIGYEYDTQ